MVRVDLKHITLPEFAERDIAFFIHESGMDNTQVFVNNDWTLLIQLHARDGRMAKLVLDPEEWGTTHYC